MKEPSFFVDDKWTGHVSLNGGSRIRFDAAGGENLDVSHNRLDEFPNNHFPFRIERTTRFRLVQEWHNGTYLLQSNCFQLQASCYILRVTVNRATGHLKIACHHRLRTDSVFFEAAITPFGIVERFFFPHSYWTWLWKCNWSDTH